MKEMYSEITFPPRDRRGEKVDKIHDKIKLETLLLQWGINGNRPLRVIYLLSASK